MVAFNMCTKSTWGWMAKIHYLDGYNKVHYKFPFNLGLKFEFIILLLLKEIDCSLIGQYNNILQCFPTFDFYFQWRSVWLKVVIANVLLSWMQLRNLIEISAKSFFRAQLSDRKLSIESPINKPNRSSCKWNFASLLWFFMHVKCMVWCLPLPCRHTSEAPVSNYKIVW